MNDERADEAVEHLQTAANEMIKAARAFLDVAEELVTDPNTSAAVMGLFDSITAAAGRATPRGRAGEDDDPVEHIPVS